MKNQPITQVPKSKKQLTWGLICLILPTALIFFSMLAYAVANFISGADSASSSDLSTGQMIINVILFLIGALGVAAWLPGIIAGIILLVTRKK